MIQIRRSIRLGAIISVVSVISGALADARRDVDIIDGWEGGYYDSYAAPLPGQETWAAYYAKHARVSSGPEKRLANGVRWRLMTDRRTRVGMPRIIWMAGNSNLAPANRLLEMVHGGAMLFSSQQQEGFLTYLRGQDKDFPRFSGLSKEDYERHLRSVRKLMPKRVVTQSDVALTYASARFASLIDLGFIYRDEGTYLPRIIRSVTLDFERRRILTMEACPEGSFRRLHAISNPTFRFADLLEICDQANLERFADMVRAAEDRIKAAVAGNKDPLVEHCHRVSIDDEQEYVVNLAVGGLAVYLTRFWSNADSRSCPLELSARNPLIIPYRTLEPLMRPGPLREELMRLN